MLGYYKVSYVFLKLIYKYCNNCYFIIKCFKRRKFYYEITIITDKITKNTVKNLIELSYFNSARNVKKKFIDAEEVNSIGNICDDVQILNIPVEHKSMEYAYGYIIKDKNISIGLTGDSTFC